MHQTSIGVLPCTHQKATLQWNRSLATCPATRNSGLPLPNCPALAQLTKNVGIIFNFFITQWTTQYTVNVLLSQHRTCGNIQSLHNPHTKWRAFSGALKHHRLDHYHFAHLNRVEYKSFLSSHINLWHCTNGNIGTDMIASARP
jgi:hypothetical protein